MARTWWPDKDFEREHIMPEQGERYEGDAWEEPIRKYLNGKAQVTVIDIAGGALGFEIERPNFLPAGTSTRHAERPSIASASATPDGLERC